MTEEQIDYRIFGARSREIAEGETVDCWPYLRTGRVTIQSVEGILAFVDENALMRK